MQSEALKIMIIGVGAIALMLGGFIAYIAHLKRVAPPNNDPTLEVAGPDADKRFAKLDGRANLLFLLLSVVFAALAYLVIYATDVLRVRLLPNAIMTFPTSHGFLGLIAGFAGMGVASMVFGSVIRSRWGEDARWYLAYASVRRYGCDYERLCHGLGVTLVFMTVLALPLALNWYVQVRDKAFVIHPLFALHERVYAYSEIQSIETAGRFIAPNGRVRHERDYVIHFKDGSRWVAANLPSGDFYDRQRVTELLAQRAGVGITEVAIFKTSDLYD